MVLRTARTQLEQEPSFSEGSPVGLGLWLNGGEVKSGAGN